ncbi:LamB/YcsF family protein [Variovorax sp. RA8]|uniref:LamB/YcsF family protein n=1 Tax=Variovorax sp. (strain JCM 16519 / RA8) TaxID=662548 RepID=UPI001316DCEA|nr:5-oxoprolinase subunit PxpA [Variovorax sp. RA8]VTU15582.1 LamB/YcsF family protein [Variovorax sp. RA8]
MTQVNLNADMGESFGKYTIGNDEELMKIIQSANIACGFHAGDPTVMTRTVRLASENGVSIGAHPGFNDLWGFGRRQIRMNARDLEYMITYQIGALQAIAHGASAKVTHVKPHGALNNMAHVDLEVATAIARGIRAADPELIFVANACSEMVTAGHAAGLRVAEEAYVDRTYSDTGLMTSRTEEDAIIKDAEVAVRQVLSFIEEQAVITRSGKRLAARIQTFCTHGDEPTAVALASKVHEQLKQRGIQLVPLTDMKF